MSISDKATCSASRKSWPSFFLSIFLLAFLICTPACAKETSLRALTMYDEAPKYAADFQHFDYVNPDAPKGGELKMGVEGAFDSLNAFIIKGIPATGTDLIYETLLQKSLDEPQTSYGLLAESMRMADDRSWVEFTLRPQAKWQDGQPVTADDVVWSFNTLVKDGAPGYRAYYSQVAKVEKTGERIVKFTFKNAGNRELPLIVGELTILPKHYWMQKGHDFTKTTLEPPLGSGPYKIKSVDSGRQIVYEHDKNWWGKDLPINKGRYNFDTVTFDYYRDTSVEFQAFLGGNIDFRSENVAKMWAQGYQHPAVLSGKIKKEEFRHSLPTGIQGFVYNTRRPIFADPRVREALAYAFDFEWANKQFAFGSYIRANSYFSNSELAATSLPAPEELKLLEPFRDKLPPRVFTDIYAAPKTNGSGDIRENLHKALDLLKQAGWTLQDGVLKDKNGKPFEFEILTEKQMFDRWVLPFVANLKKLGIDAKYRVIDVSQYQNRMNDFDFDMTLSIFPESQSPGNEQAAYWGSGNADTPGSANVMGIKNPVIDALIPHITHATTREELVTATHALDRVLQWNFYMIPQWYLNNFRIAYWAKLGHPDKNPPYGLPVIDTWWVK
jgi:microcin C transport system substrate-binding protein